MPSVEMTRNPKLQSLPQVDQNPYATPDLKESSHFKYKAKSIQVSKLTTMMNDEVSETLEKLTNIENRKAQKATPYGNLSDCAQMI
jgi:hypothetical protein